MAAPIIARLKFEGDLYTFILADISETGAAVMGRVTAQRFIRRALKWVTIWTAQWEDRRNGNPIITPTKEVDPSLIQACRDALMDADRQEARHAFGGS